MEGKEEIPSGRIKMTPGIWIALFYVSGILLSPLIPLSPVKILIFSLLYSLLSFFVFRQKGFRQLLFSVFFLIGIAHPQFVLHQRAMTESTLEDVVRFSGIVTTVPALTSTGKSKSFILSVDRLEGREQKLRFFTFLPEHFQIQPGNRLEGIGRIQRNDSTYFLDKGLYGNLSVSIVEAIDAEKNAVSLLASVRQLVLTSVTYGITGDNKSLIEGLMLGVRTDMPPRIQRIFSDTGTVHILAVSGLHLGIIAFVVFLIVRTFIRNNLVRLAVLAMAVILYTLLIGDVASLLRAAVMTEIGIIALILDRDRNYYNIAALAATLLLAMNPYHIWNIGFQLSFAAVIGMIAFNGFFLRVFSWMPKWLRENVAVSFSAQMLVIPFILVYFHRMVLISYVVNIFAVPLSSANIILGFISFFLAIPGLWPLVGVLNQLNSWLMTALTKATGFFADFYYVRADEMSFILLTSILILIVSLYIIANHAKLRKTAVVLSSVGILLFVPGLLLSQERLVKIIIPNLGAKGAAVLVLTDVGERVLYLSADTQKASKALPRLFMANNTESIDVVYIGTKMEKESLAALGKLEEDFTVRQVILVRTNFAHRQQVGRTLFLSSEDGWAVKFDDSLFALGDLTEQSHSDGDYVRKALFSKDNKIRLLDSSEAVALDTAREVTVRLFENRISVKSTKW